MIHIKQKVMIREAEPSDIEQLKNLYLDSASHHVQIDRVLYRMPSEESVLDHFTRWFEQLQYERESGVLLIAEISGVPIGYVVANALSTPGDGSMIRLRKSIDIGLSVAGRYRGHGIGSALMLAIETWGREHGFERITLNSHAMNDGAIRFYQERHGYRTIGLVMEKGL